MKESRKEIACLLSKQTCWQPGLPLWEYINSRLKSAFIQLVRCMYCAWPMTINDWTANDHSLKVKDIIWQDLRFLSFYFFVCPCAVGLSALCTPQFWSHKLVDPYLGTLCVQLDAIKRIFWKFFFFLSKNRKKLFFYEN